MTLQTLIKNLYENPSNFNSEDFNLISKELIGGLNSGKIRSAEKNENDVWIVNDWVKKGILLLFKYGNLVDYSINKVFNFFDKHTLPTHNFQLEDNIRIVPGGSSIRTGSYIAPGVICMPPMYINIGAFVDEGTMIDSHALVGTCAQIGKRVHLSAASQIGGVLEPPNARPVIVEDDVMIGGNCGVYEGTLIRSRAVLGSGVVITSSTKIFDLVQERIIKAEAGNPIEIPEGAVVVPGARKINTPFAAQYGLSISSPIIIKYRDEKTDSKTALEDYLR